MQALKAKGRVVIDIEKRLPVQGGLGGASSNAVAGVVGAGVGAEEIFGHGRAVEDCGGSWF